MLTLSLPLGLLLLFVAIVGLGTSGTQTLIYGFVANYFTHERPRRGRGLVRRASAGSAASAARCSAASWSPRVWRSTPSSTSWPRWPSLGTILTLLVPTRRAPELHSIPIEPSVAPEQGVAAAGSGHPTA